jgi:hypothetical protein
LNFTKRCSSLGNVENSEIRKGNPPKRSLQTKLYFSHRVHRKNIIRKKISAVLRKEVKYVLLSTQREILKIN